MFADIHFIAVRLRPTPFELPFDALTSMLKSTGGLGDLKKKTKPTLRIFFIQKIEKKKDVASFCNPLEFLLFLVSFWGMHQC